MFYLNTQVFIRLHFLHIPHLFPSLVPSLFHQLRPTVPSGNRICLPGYRSHRKYCNNCCCCCCCVDTFLVCACSTKRFKKSRALAAKKEGGKSTSQCSASLNPPCRQSAMCVLWPALTSAPATLVTSSHPPTFALTSASIAAPSPAAHPVPCSIS